MKVKELAEKWKKFRERQERILNRNLNSDEYHEWKKQMPVISSWHSFSRFTLDIWFNNLGKIREKDLYSDTLEGMLQWINDGEKG